MSTVEEIVQGKGKFIDDIILPGMQHMAVVRSNYSRGKIVNVKGGYTFKDFPAYMASVGEGATEGEKGLIEPVMADKYVNYIGEPIAVVLGKDRYDAEDRTEDVEVEIEPLPPMMDPEKSLESPPVYSFMKSNVYRKVTLGSDFRTDGFEIEIEGHFNNRRVATDPIETRGIVAAYEKDLLTVWISTQSVHSIKEGLSEILNMPPEKIRVIQADTGGAFGLKGGVYPEYAIAAFLSIKTGKPVKWIENRHEHLMASRPGRGTSAYVKLYANKSGKILGLKGKVIVDSGAYSGGSGEFAARFVGMQMTGPYKIDNAYVEAFPVYTNKVVQGPYRGAGRPEAHFFIERMIDMLADKLKMDPVEVRLINTVDKDFKSPLGMDVPPAKSFLEDAINKLGYRKLLKDKPGFAFFVLVPAFQPGETARIKIENGEVKVWLGGDAHGQRHDLFVKTLVNEGLGINRDLVHLQLGDTGMLKDGVGTWGSRTAIVGGMAVHEACKKIKQAFTAKHGLYSSTALLQEGADEYVHWRGEGSMNSLGCNLATCEVNNRGQVKVKECSAYYDVGRALTPEVVRGQIAGGMAQGIGQTLYEEIMYSDDGQLLTASIADAGVPIANQLPEYKVFLAVTRSNLAIGTKGVGESPTIGTPIALSRAIENVTGVKIFETPIKQELLISKLKH